ncbi:MAG: hypothetical protein IT423_07545, partial [Pirellulaceae bacterium]|nr:hypothetical protein [Pirellulaceae bacterium]
MRSLRLLAAGLAVIALWGICLQLMITRWRVDSEPQRLANDLNAQPLTDRSATDESKIQLAAFNHPAPLPADVSVKIDSVVDPAETLRWDKKFQEVWLSSLQVNLNIAETVAAPNLRYNGQLLAQNIAVTGNVLSLTLPDNVKPIVYISVFKTDAAPEVRLSDSPVADSVKLRVHRPTDLPRPPRALTLQLGTHYPVIYDSFPSPTRIFPSQKSRIRFGVDATPQASQLTVIEYEENASTKIVRSVSPPLSVSGDAPVAIDREIDARDLKAGSTDIGCYFVGHSPDGTIAFSDEPVPLKVGKPISNLPTKATFTLENIIHGKANAIASEGTPLPEFATTNQLTRPDASIKHTYSPEADAPKFAWRLFANGRPCSAPAELGASTEPVRILGLELDEGTNILEARFFQGEQQLKEIPLGTVNVKTGGFRITEIGPPEFGRTIGVGSFYIDFTDPVKLSSDDDNARLTSVKAAILVSKSVRGVFAPNSDVKAVAIQSSNLTGNRLTITPAAETTATAYLIKVLGGKLMDVYGNLLEGSDGRVGAIYEQRLGSTGVDSPDLYPVTPGVTRGQAPVVTYPQFVEPNQQPKGFNPNDRVETRVARLYFYRDAHRVAQILNRRAQSYNRQDVAMRRQFADKARQEADSLTTARQIAERRAVETAQKTRELQNQASDLQRSMDFSLRQMQQLALSGPPPNMSPQDFQTLQRQQLGQLENATRDLSNQIRDVESQLRNARDTEVVSNEQMQQAQRGEELAKAEQFRLETAAAHADPDTFAAGDPNSIDPVAQVSISVIGEGLLHLRGPLRGVNQVRIMIDQMDAPCGQVRLNIHSTQINGDEADKMEVVANRIQTYIDQARFLTVQSGEMLRKSVVQCAATRAEESRGLYPGETQADRDQRYLYSFFGRDFAEELRAMDSEMLRTGNKLLSLHSMDVTSLSSALMLMALANNSSRLAILQQFEALVKTELAQAEQQYMHNGIGCCTNGCKPGCKHHKEAPPICYLRGNASFTSLRGFFDTQLSHDDTMSPLQREMIRLAQILKARLVTEMEYKQRVMERALIEERLESVTDTNAQLGRERATQQELVMARESLYKARAVVIPNITQSMS